MTITIPDAFGGFHEIFIVLKTNQVPITNMVPIFRSTEEIAFTIPDDVTISIIEQSPLEVLTSTPEPSTILLLGTVLAYAGQRLRKMLKK